MKAGAGRFGSLKLSAEGGDRPHGTVFFRPQFPDRGAIGSNLRAIDFQFSCFMVPIVRDSENHMYERFVERRAREALSDTPVVLIVGPRRAGKTTLVRKMGETGRTHISLDDMSRRQQQ